MTKFNWQCLLMVLLLCCVSPTFAAAPVVTLQRVPNGGIQPQVIVDARGTIHMIYYTGDPGHGDIYYVRSINGGRGYSRPMRVNSQPGSAIAAGNIRGAQIAVGRNGRVHVAWNGAGPDTKPHLPTLPNIPGSKYHSPMLYTRMKSDGSGFEPQRNLMQHTYGLDGGGSVAADDLGNVYVAWHAGAGNWKDESERRVWIARSSNDGKSFTREAPAWNEPTGACGCCGLRIFADPSGDVFLLYRAAIRREERDMFLLSGRPHTILTGTRVGRWHINSCPMSSESFASLNHKVVGAWETKGQVYFALINPDSRRIGPGIPAPGDGTGRKYPAAALNSRGEVLLAWTEDMGWARGGSVAWQVFDPLGRPIKGAGGRASGVPAWSLVAAYAHSDGSFSVVY